VELKRLIEGRQRWSAMDEERSYFETPWKPKSWPRRCRFVMIRTRAKLQQKEPVQLDLFEPYNYIPVRTRCGNETYLLASLFAYNLIRDLQMQLEPPTRTTTRKRSTLWQFEQVSTIRRTVLQRTGRLSTPSGKLVLTFCTGKNLKQRVLQIFAALAT
ncbi:MAG: hypothetical protein ABI614_19745, partial [Planctomycetota bacterium]